MKKYFIFAVIAGAALVGCTKEASTTATDEAITFKTPVAHFNTKADGVQTGTLAQTDAFGVYVYYYANSEATEGAKYIDDAKIYYHDDMWTTENLYFWPKSDDATLSFYAYYPYDADEYFEYDADAENGLKVKEYNVDEKATWDLMIATKQTGLNKENSQAKAGVTTTFNHLLGHIQGLTIKTDKDYTKTATITLKSITLKGIDYKGTYSGSEWTATNTDTVNEALHSTDLTVTSEEKACNVTDNGYYFVMPQTFTADAEELEVVYDVEVGGSSETVTAHVYLAENLTTGFVASKAYTFNLTISLLPIFWDDPTADKWSEVKCDITVD